VCNTKKRSQREESLGDTSAAVKAKQKQKQRTVETGKYESSMQLPDKPRISSWKNWNDNRFKDLPGG
jgi:hypothetical protein